MEKFSGSHPTNIHLKSDHESEQFYCDLVILVKRKPTTDLENHLEDLNVSDTTTSDCESGAENSPDTKSKNENDEIQAGGINDKEEIKVHGVVLGTISPYFHTMMKVEMKEKHDKIVDLTHLDADAVKLVVSFIYGGDIVLTKENINDILHIADYMQLIELKGFCHNFLQSIIDDDSCVSLFFLSKTYNLPMLSQKALVLICRNIRYNLYDTRQQILKFSFDQIMELLTCPYDKMCISLLYEVCVEWINHDLSARTPHLYEMMTVIDFKKLKPSYLSKVVAKEDLIQKSLSCQKLLLDAYEFHTNPETIEKEKRREELESIVIEEASTIDVKVKTGRGYFKLDKSWHEKWKNYTTNNGHGWQSKMTREEWHGFTPPGPIDNSPLLGKGQSESCCYVEKWSWHRLVARHGIISEEHAIKK